MAVSLAVPGAFVRGKAREDDIRAEGPDRAHHVGSLRRRAECRHGQARGTGPGRERPGSLGKPDEALRLHPHSMHPAYDTQAVARFPGMPAHRM